MARVTGLCRGEKGGGRGSSSPRPRRQAERGGKRVGINSSGNLGVKSLTWNVNVLTVLNILVDANKFEDF